MGRSENRGRVKGASIYKKLSYITMLITYLLWGILFYLLMGIGEYYSRTGEWGNSEILAIPTLLFSLFCGINSIIYIFVNKRPWLLFLLLGLIAIAKWYVYLVHGIAHSGF